MGATVTGLALAAGNPAVPWPYGWYSQPVYPGALLTPGFGLMAQNPYLPQPSAAPQVQPAVPVITWPFFVVPQPQSPVQAPSSAPVAAAKSAPVLSDAAREALAQAEAYAKAARAAFTLWVPAENALNAALEAAKEGDSAAVLKHAQAVSDLTRLGAAQAKYPSTESEPELSGDVRVALAQAEIDVQSARSAFTLWVPAENALNAALQAAKEGDSAECLKHAKAASGLAKLGAEQAKYPSTESEPELSSEAKQAFAQAEADVQAARAAFTLWVPAENALNAALQGAKEGDSAAVLKHAKAASDLAKLGAEQAKYPSTEAAPELSGEAQQALARAEADVQAARAAFTLWVPAENALSAALQGAKEGDSAAVLKHAQAVSDLTRLGTAQAGYPSTEMPSKATAKKKAKRKPKPKTKPKTKTKKTAVAKPAAAAPQSTGATTRSTPQLSKATVPTANPAPPPEAGARQVRPRKLCWQGDRLEECP
jgi:hypothetical protein